MSTAPRYEPRSTVADWRQWEGRWELWNGLAVAMTPSPFGRHAKALTDAAAAFKYAVDDAENRPGGCRATVLTEIDWIVAHDTVVRPDLVVVCGGVPERHVETAPAIVVEILSPATRERDLTVKKDLYLDQGVAWYVVVDPDDGTVELFERVATGATARWTSHPVGSGTADIMICDRCRVTVPLAALTAARGA